MITVLSCNYSDADTCREIFRIRTEVFVSEQKVTREEEFDGYEESSMHYLGKWNDRPAGTARWRITKNGIKLERFAVLLPLRRNGIAAAVLREVLKDVSPLGKRIYLHAQFSEHRPLCYDLRSGLRACYFRTTLFSFTIFSFDTLRV
jgi:predicted GNAT family N-acyltransferase